MPTIRGNFFERRLKQCPVYAFEYAQADQTEIRRDPFLLVYIKRGRAIHHNGGTEYPIQSGDCFVVLPDDPHSYRHSENLLIVNMLFYPRIFAGSRDSFMDLQGFRDFLVIEPTFRAATGFRHKLHLNSIQRKTVSAIVDDLLREQNEDKPGAPIVCRALFHQMLVLLSRYFSDRSSSSVTLEGRDPVTRAIAYIEREFEKPITLDELSEELHISRSHLSHVFKKQTGTSLFDYLLRIRLDRACALLENKGLSVGEIAFSVGFNDPNYFSRAFKFRAGLSPSEYREKRAGSTKPETTPRLDAGGPAG
jgi:AraC-like DNA-binding protein